MFVNVFCYTLAMDATNSKRETTDKETKVQGILRFTHTKIN